MYTYDIFVCIYIYIYIDLSIHKYQNLGCLPGAPAKSASRAATVAAQRRASQPGTAAQTSKGLGT